MEKQSVSDQKHDATLTKHQTLSHSSSILSKSAKKLACLVSSLVTHQNINRHSVLTALAHERKLGIDLNIIFKAAN